MTADDGETYYQRMTLIVNPPCSTPPTVDLVLPSAALFKELPKTGDVVFDQAIRVVFLHEGIFSDDPSDPGGPTKYGISLRAAQKMGDLDGDGKLDLDLDADGDVDINDIRLLTPEKVVDIYRRAYWLKTPYRNFHFSVAVKMFDLSVNMGQKQANVILQRALRAARPSGLPPLIEDGVIGTKTIASVQEAYTPSLLAATRSEAAGFYRRLAAQRTASQKYLNGWLNRAYF